MRRIYEWVFVLPWMHVAAGAKPQIVTQEDRPIYTVTITHTAGVQWEAGDTIRSDAPPSEKLTGLCFHVCFLSQALNQDPEAILKAALEEINSPDIDIRPVF